MQRLIEVLSAQHAEILHMRIELSLVDDPEIRWRLFQAFESTTLKHLEQEDREFYGILRERQVNHHEEKYDEHLRLTRHAREFFAWWPTPASVRGPEFEAALEQFFETLKERMRFEEQSLFAEHREMAPIC